MTYKALSELKSSILLNAQLLLLTSLITELSCFHFFLSSCIIVLSLSSHPKTCFLASLLFPFHFFAVTHMHEKKLHLALSNPPPDTLPRPEAKCQWAKSCGFHPLALFSAPPAGVKAQWILKHFFTSPHWVNTGLDQSLRRIYHQTHVSQMNVYECLCECNRKNQSYSPNTHPSRYVVVLENNVSDWIPLHCNSHRVQPKSKAIQTLKA